jgi:tetratricopeptide (TPR) repeat protein
LGASANAIDYGRAINLFHLGRQSDAHQLFTELANHNPGYAYMAGLTAPNSQEKLRCMRLAISKSPNDYVSHYGLGLALKEASTNSEAKPSFERALELCEMRLASRPDDDQAWRFKAHILHELGRWAEEAEAIELRRMSKTITANTGKDHASYPSASSDHNQDT